MEWKEYNICQLCDTISETYKGKSNSVVLINTSDVLEGKVLNHKRVPNKGLKGQFKKTFKKNDILYSEIRPANKRFAYINFSPNDYIASTKLMVLRSKPIVSSYFLFQILKSEIVLKNLQMLAESRSGTFPQITYSELSNVRVKVPPLPVQDKIVGILSALDSKIENNNKINANLEAQAQALFKSWFVDFTPFKDQPFVDSELGPIPQGWKVGKLGDYCETICRGLTPKYNLDSKEIVLGQTCVRNNIVTLNNARKHQPKGKTEKKVQQWDTLINSTGIGSLGRVGIVYFDYNYVSFDSHITVVRATNPLLRPYIGRNLVSRQLEIENLAIGSTGQTELPRESVKSITLYIPTQKVLESFNCIIKPLSLKILKNIQENQRLAALRDTLLPKLMSGEIKL